MPTITDEPINTNTLQVQSAGEHPTHAVILVGGIHESYHYWDSWAEKLGGPDTLVAGFDHDHTKDTMPNSAHMLASEIEKLKAQGIEDITIVAHSMGGLVSKGALDEMAKDGHAADFKHIELQAFGTPWGGFAMAESAHILPGAAAISRAVGFPMGPDIGPGSDYMKSLAQPLPGNVDLHMYIGSDDKVARPEASSTHARYDSVEANAKSVTVIEGFKHTDYREAGPELMNASRQAPVQGFESVPLNNREANATQPLQTFEVAHAPVTPAADFSR